MRTYLPNGADAPIARGTLKTWQNFATFVEADPSLSRYFTLDQLQENPEFPEWKDIRRKYYLFSPLAHFVSRYLHFSGGTSFDAEKFLPIYLEWEKSILPQRLSFSICVPIVCTKFSFDTFELTPDASIEKLPDAVQLARNRRRTHNDASHEVVIGAATHALVLKDWSIANPNQRERESTLHDFAAFSSTVQIVDKFFAAVRAVTGISTGYCQLVIVPDGWGHAWRALLPHLYVVSTRAYPAQFENFGWLNDRPPLTEAHAAKIGALFSALRSAKEHKLAIATRRLNTAYLRRDDSDSILDLAIGLEALFVGDSNAEITHKLAMRVAALSAIDAWPQGGPTEIFALVKKVYAYRSAVVHGTGDAEKKRVITVGPETKHDAVELGLALLRHAIISLAAHPEFLNAAALDEFLLRSSLLPQTSPATAAGN
jgi:hypothetical protein